MEKLVSFVTLRRNKEGWEEKKGKGGQHYESEERKFVWAGKAFGKCSEFKNLGMKDRPPAHRGFKLTTRSFAQRPEMARS